MNDCNNMTLIRIVLISLFLFLTQQRTSRHVHVVNAFTGVNLIQKSSFHFDLTHAASGSKYTSHKQNRALSYTSNSSNEQQEQQDLLEKARLLREQAKAIEETLQRSRSYKKKGTNDLTSTTTSATSAISPPPRQIKDSKWTLSYRFANQPEPLTDENDDNSHDKNLARTFYSGKVTIHFKDDGYSVQVLTPADEDNKNKSSKKNDIKIVKIWGWDQELSNENKEEDRYILLFSIDVQLPEQDPQIPNTIQRYYFQINIVQNRDNTISLTDGTITMKQDVSQKTNGRWGLFNVAGILTQFSYCGDFIAKPYNY